MAQPQPAGLELGEGPVGGLVSIAGRGVDQRAFSGQHVQHLLGIGLPVGRAVQVAAGGEMLHELGDEFGLDQAALVVALLVPGVGKEDVHAGQQLGAEHVAQHLDRVVLDDADIAQLLLIDELQQRADTGLVDLAADEVVVGQRGRDLGGPGAHAEADLQHQRGLAAEDLFRGDAPGPVGQHEPGAQLDQRLDLARAHAAGARDEALDGAARRVFLVLHQPTSAMTMGVAATSASPSVTAAR